jgi:hypothetical protein
MVLVRLETLVDTPLLKDMLVVMRLTILHHTQQMAAAAVLAALVVMEVVHSAVMAESE